MGQHTDDGGELTLFTSGNELLIACNQGHFWIIPATQGSVEQQDPSHESVRVNADGVQDLTDRFGSAAAQALGF